MKARSAALVIAALAWPRADAFAGPGDWRGTATLEIDADYAANIDRGVADERDHQGSFGVLVRGMVGKHGLHYGVGFDYRFGASVPGGFVYSANLFPVGFGISAGDWVKLGLFVGAGISGVTGKVAFAGQLPVEARLDFRVGDPIAISAAAQIAWTTGDVRNGGSVSVDSIDELRVQVGVRVSRRYLKSTRRLSGGDGYYLALVYEERLGSQMVGGAFGYSFDFVGGG